LQFFSLGTEIYIVSHALEQWDSQALQNHGSSVWNLLCVTLLKPRIFRWLLDLWKICEFLLHYNIYKPYVFGSNYYYYYYYYYYYHHCYSSSI